MRRLAFCQACLAPTALAASLAVLLFSASLQGQGSPIAFVQSNYSAAQTRQTSVAVPYTAVQSTGNLNVVVVGWSDATSVVQSVTDLKGNLYVRAVGPTVQSGFATQAIYYAANIAAAAAGGNSVNITFTTRASSPEVRVAEYSGIDRVNPLDVVVGSVGNSTTSNSGTIATSSATALLIGADFAKTSTTAAGPGYVARVITSPNGNILEDRVVTSTGSYSATSPLLGKGAWIMQLAAFRAASTDAQSPSAPTSLTATAASSTQIALSWAASTDNVGVSGYRVERCQGAGCTNFAQVGSVTATSYGDTVLTASTSYSYRIRASDAAGNSSSYSNTAAATTLAGPDTQPPTVPANTTATAASSTQIDVSWTASTDNVGVVGYRVERCKGAACSNFVQVGAPPGTSYTDTGLTASTSYRYRVRAGDTANNLSGYSSVASGTTLAPPDVQAPTAPANLTATAASTSQINLAWTASTDNVGVTGYRLERCQDTGCTNFAQVAIPTGTGYSDTALTESTRYNYRVRAIDAANNASLYSTTAGATTPGPPDTQPPTAPAGLTATAASGSQINLSWIASTDNVGVTGYRVERCQGAGCTNFTKVAAPAGTIYSDIGLTASANYSFRVRSADAANNLSPYSAGASATTQAAPAVITFRQVNAALPQSPQATVTVRFTGVQIEGDLNVVIIGWSDSTSHVVSVVDTSGNVYAPALAPTVQPGIQSIAIYFATNIVAAAANANAVTVTFDAAARYPDLRVAEYGGIDPVNPVDGAIGATGSGTTSSSGALTTTNANDLLVAGNVVQTVTSGPGTGFTSRVITSPDGNILEDRVVTSTGSYTATAPLSGSGGWTMQLVAFRRATPSGDTQPPSVPADLSATAAGVQIDLAWSASADDIAVTGYRVERCQGPGCSTFSQIASTTATTYSDAFLAPSTSYSYRVRATDGASFSAYSATASAMTGSTPPPTISIATPTAGAPLSGTVNFGATVTGSAVGGVQFQVDGVNVGSPAAAPYYISFNTAQFANGSHTVAAYAWDSLRRIATAAPVAVTFSNASPGNPAQTGLWSAVLPWPGFVSVHINLLRDGRVMAWDRMNSGNPDPQLWDPVTSILTPVPTNDPANLFCAGSVTLPDGRVLSAGGHASDHVGIPAGRIFNPATNQWTSTPDMAYGRWYPTVTTLADGRILALAGEVNCPGCDAKIPEIYDPATNTWTTVPGASLLLPFYPHAYVLPDGRVVVAATTESPFATRVLNLTTATWSIVDSQLLDAYSSAMYLPGKILKSGTSTDSESTKTSAATAYVIDMTAAAPRWRPIASMAFARAYHVMTLLPDGNVLVTGGGRTTGDYDIPNAVYAAELWSPATETWTTLSSMHAPRLYHGTALLLPDGRVLVSGGGRSPGPDSRDQESGEVFAPPYLFQGPRPTIAAAPAQLGYNQPFVVQSPDASRISKVALVAVGNMTHGINMNQRYVPLNFTAGEGTLTIAAPANSNLAPPGQYMLFIVDGLGVPSIASFVSF